MASLFRTAAGAALAFVLATQCYAESFWGPVVRGGVSAGKGAEQPLDKSKPDIAGIKLGMPNLAAKRALTLNTEPPLLVNELFNDEVPGSYGLMAYDTSPACRVQDVCRVRMRVLFSRGKVWFIAREYQEGPFQSEADAMSQLKEITSEISMHYGALTSPLSAKYSDGTEVHAMYLRSGTEAPEDSVCFQVEAQKVIGVEPLSFPRECGWSYRHALELVPVGKVYYVRGVLQLANLDQEYPEATEPKARKADLRKR